jgi:exosortase/archaeosortase family protein
MRSVLTSSATRRSIAWGSGIAAAAWLLLVDPARIVEARLTSLVLQTLGVGPSYGTDGAGVLIATRDHGVVRAVVTRQCSGTSIALALGGLALVMLPGRRGARLRGALLVAAALVAVNVGRLVLTLVVAQSAGLTAMTLVHDWAGTFITFASATCVVVVLRGAMLRGRSANLAKDPWRS